MKIWALEALTLISIPAYVEWSKRKLEEGECPALIANLDATGMMLRPEEVATVGEDVFEEMLADLKWTIVRSRQRSEPA